MNRHRLTLSILVGLISCTCIARDITPRQNITVETTSEITKYPLRMKERSSKNFYISYTESQRPLKLNTNDIVTWTMYPTNDAWSQVVTGTVHNADRGTIRVPLTPSDTATNGTYTYDIIVTGTGGVPIMAEMTGDITLLPVSGTSTAFPTNGTVVNLAGFTFVNYPWDGRSSFYGTNGVTAAAWVASNDFSHSIVSSNTLISTYPTNINYWTSFAGGNWTGKFDGVEGSFYTNAANMTGTLATAVQDVITRVGTIVSGVWNGSVIPQTYFAVTGNWSGTFDSQQGSYYLNAANQTGTLADAVQDGITGLGTITSGVWQGTAVAQAYMTVTGNWTGTLDGFEAATFVHKTNVHAGDVTGVWSNLQIAADAVGLSELDLDAVDSRYIQSGTSSFENIYVYGTGYNTDLVTDGTFSLTNLYWNIQSDATWNASRIEMNSSQTGTVTPSNALSIRKGGAYRVGIQIGTGGSTVTVKFGGDSWDASGAGYSSNTLWVTDTATNLVFEFATTTNSDWFDNVSVQEITNGDAYVASDIYALRVNANTGLFDRVYVDGAATVSGLLYMVDFAITNLLTQTALSSNSAAATTEFVMDSAASEAWATDTDTHFTNYLDAAGTSNLLSVVNAARGGSNTVMLTTNTLKTAGMALTTDLIPDTDTYFTNYVGTAGATNILTQTGTANSGSNNIVLTTNAIDAAGVLMQAGTGASLSGVNATNAARLGNVAAAEFIQRDGSVAWTGADDKGDNPVTNVSTIYAGTGTFTIVTGSGAGVTDVNATNSARLGNIAAVDYLQVTGSGSQLTGVNATNSARLGNVAAAEFWQRDGSVTATGIQNGGGYAYTNSLTQPTSASNSALATTAYIKNLAVAGNWALGYTYGLDWNTLKGGLYSTQILNVAGIASNVSTLVGLTDNSMADALHRHSELSASDGTPDAAVQVDATGQVGIGTNTPGRKLTIVDTGNAAQLRLSGGGIENSNFEMQTAQATDIGIAAIAAAGSQNRWEICDGSLKFAHTTHNAEFEGNVGIKTNAAARALTVEGEIALGSQLSHPAAFAAGGQVYSVTNEVYAMDSSGNVSILTPHPDFAGGEAVIFIEANVYDDEITYILKSDLVKVMTGLVQPNATLLKMIQTPEYMKRDWDTDEQVKVDKSSERRERWEAEDVKIRSAVKPKLYKKRVRGN